MQTTYPNIKSQNPHLQSKDVISIVAKQWADVPEIDKKIWQDRAKSYSIDNNVVSGVLGNEGSVLKGDDEGSDDDDDDATDDDSTDLSQMKDKKKVKDNVHTEGM